jgi:hypothetical protein
MPQFPGYNAVGYGASPQPQYQQADYSAYGYSIHPARGIQSTCNVELNIDFSCSRPQPSQNYSPQSEYGYHQPPQQQYYRVSYT